MMTSVARAPLRVRFETRRRELTVVETVRLTPHMQRIVLTGDLTGFQSLGFDDHIKLFLADPETGVLTLPGLDSGPKPVMRDYTPRRFDVAKGQLTLDFALHGDSGPATAWALAAKPGDILNIGGPRGSQILPDGYDGFVLMGDETALPAIGRRLEELPAGTPVTVLAEIENDEDRQDWQTQAKATVRWIVRGKGENLVAAAASLALPEGDVHIWVAAEAQTARTIRQALIDRGAAAKSLKAAGYWHRGAVAAHEPIE
ncbi:siderophore-interacting family protein [Asticcacaulis biprosthecium C19]|uniref:Siderophore-interacting family protein n=1 Tax=Asticcacaulis biprosthecium C19 TaxID=715226 RepID=F4QGL9_9CAUL|nr:siderophore-interacting protein [Asticcacaulis biprosthecium]EGF93700.1 siderophore-interacting family protein [Asticcacaulis biprosthecium C19]